MNIVAIDFGRTTGIAKYDGFLFYAHRELPKDCAKRAVAYTQLLDELIGGIKQVHVLYELANFRQKSKDASDWAGYYKIRLLEYCYGKDNVTVEGIPVCDIKKHMTGKGNAKKDDIAGALFRLGYPSKINNNAADALAMLLMHLDAKKTGTK